VFKIAHIAVGLGQGGSVADLANLRDRPHMFVIDQSMQPTAPARGRPVVLPLATERACQMFTAEQYRVLRHLLGWPRVQSRVQAAAGEARADLPPVHRNGSVMGA
jgi:hypothetical protein